MQPQNAVVHERSLAEKFNGVQPRPGELHVEDADTYRYNLLAGWEMNHKWASPADGILRSYFDNFDVIRHRAETTYYL
jgi:hypothetical protein